MPQNQPTPPTLREVVQELVQDVDAAYGADGDTARALAGDGWPDLAETYKRAKDVLGRREREILLLRIDNTPAEDEVYTIGAVLIPDSMSYEEASAEIRMQRDQWLCDAFNSGDDLQEDDFLRHLARHGYDSAEGPHELVL